VRRKDTRTHTLLSAPVGRLSGLEAQGEISELLNELYGDGLTWHREFSLVDAVVLAVAYRACFREPPQPKFQESPFHALR
jgi:hypothetical protein